MAAHAPHLPDDDVLLEILVRLPARSIGRFRAVCRSWLAATTQPSFDRALAGRPPTVGEITSEVTFLGTNKRLGDVLKFDLFHGRWHRSGNDDDDVHVIGPSSSPSAIAFTRVNDYHAFTVHGSWDGVLCLQRRWVPPANDYLVLWNPITQAVATAPVPDDPTGRFIGGYARPAARRFHLLHCSDRAVRDQPGLLAPVAFRILRLGDARWRDLPGPTTPDGSMIFMMESPVSVHGNLQWLVLSETTGKVTLIVFDTAHEEFRLMVAPERPGLRLETARTAVLSSGKLCVLALRKAPPSSADTPDTVEMWVLDDYHGADPLTWRRMRGNIRMIPMDGARADLSRFTLATAVEAVEGAEEGEEILFRWQERIDAYNVRGDVWRSVSVAKDASLVIHRASVLLPETSFGEAVRLLPREEDIFGQRPYCL